MRLQLLLCLLTVFVKVTSPSLNLFLDQNEVKLLLGLETENKLFYVQDGLIKQNAIGYMIPVPSWTDVLHFTWYMHKPYSPLHYKLSLSSSDADIISVPKVNISTAGTVPPIPQVWGVNVACSGRKSGIVVITIDIILNQLDANKLTNTTLLSFKRTKECQLFFVEKLENEGKTKRDPVEEGESSRSYLLFFTSIGGCVCFLIVVFTAVIITWLRRRNTTKYRAVNTSAPQNSQKSVSHSFLNSSQATSATLPLQGGFHNTDGRNGLDDGLPEQTATFPNVSAPLTGQPTLQVDQGQILLSNNHVLNENISPILPVPPSEGSLYRQAPHRSVDDILISMSESDSKYTQSQIKTSRHHQPCVPIQEIQVDRLSLTLGELLHEGTFGRIYQGRLDQHGNTKDVMVKTVMMGSSNHQSSNLVKESSHLYGITHRHVLPLVATTSDGSSPMRIYVYTSPGNLKKFLISSTHQPLSTHQCVMLGLQLLTALKHLHKRRIIHRDVATRNCFLSGSNLTVRLADSALSRDLFPNDYHCLGDNENRPVKWMSVECISGSQDYSSSSDVWSWAVTLWEILTRGQQPFPDVDPFEMENYLLDGFRLHQPINCPDQLYSVMSSCWSHNARDRCSVHSLYTNLSAFSSELQQFV